jgi:hypothetical protein
MKNKGWGYRRVAPEHSSSKPYQPGFLKYFRRIRIKISKMSVLNIARIQRLFNQD